MPRTIRSILALACMATPAWGQFLQEFSDDFKTVTTYNSASALAPCSGGPSAKYTVFEALTSDIFNEQVWSGGDKLTFVNRTGVVTPPILPGRVELAVIGRFGLGLGCPGDPPLFSSDTEFSNDDVCAYGGHIFNPWNLRPPASAQGFITNGPDGQPGIAGVDDNGNGTTDEQDENLASIPTTVNGGYGNKDGTGYGGGADGAPGAAGVDDDGNGITDDIGETGWPATDDGDDTNRSILWCVLNGDLSKSETMYLNIDVSGVSNQFDIQQVTNLINSQVSGNNEIGLGFYNPGTSYNWVWCVSGTCHGAQLWTGTNMANPDETLGPVINTQHLAVTAKQVALGYVKNVASDQFLRHMSFKPNDNFSHKFWFLDGNPLVAWPSPSSDLDGDKDVDASDFLTFSNCFNGSLNPPKGICGNLDADLDGDGDVDASDFLTFSNCFNGSLLRPKTLCFPPMLTAGAITCP